MTATPASSASHEPATPSAEQALWDAYHLLLMGPDSERLRKLLVRYDAFRLALELPGDIVECGVFKGAGLLTWLKFLHVHAPGSARRVIGFDTFDAFAAPPAGDAAANGHDAAVVAAFVRETGHQGTSPASLLAAIAAAGIAAERCELVAGDIRTTASDYARANPGLRISLLHMDLDLGEPTFAALSALWPRVVPGGVVVFDEYAAPRWSESDGVERFFAGTGVRLRTWAHARTPTAYVIKP
ncbi:MAG: class I SAM-dependent methyltransferase [Deltaproteobacteria bacterium]|nr:class I SAM-dependent methyltransferase [Deltaproteobacteria bacterium]